MFDSAPLSFRNTEIRSGFWKAKKDLNRTVTIRSVRDRFEDTGRFEAFKFNWKEGSDIPRPHFFWDSDVAKWLESVFYIVSENPDDELMKKAEEVISLIEKNQQPDGYFNIYHTLIEPELKFKNRDHHELYCLGHLIEAAVAYKETTGNNWFIDILDRYIDLVIKVFVKEKSAEFTTPGHEEIEIALIKLYRTTQNKKYLDLASFFINMRGVNEEYTPDWNNSKYYQSEVPVRKFKEANGHAVRACYLYSAMADLAKETDDAELTAACKRLFDDIYYKKMYITGGVGSSHFGEAFTVPYDMPNDRAYNETCASIAFSFFANRMKDLELDSKYADAVETEMYNGALSGLSLDGKAFFYENPVEINLIDRIKDVSVNDSERLPITQRLEVFGCSCCPPNITRYIASIGDTLYSYGKDKIYVHQFMTSDAVIDDTRITTETNYPSDGKINIKVTHGKGKTLYVRIPGWCTDYSFSKDHSVVSGYAEIKVTDDDYSLDIDFNMKPEFWFCSSKVRENAGKTAIKYGPIVYCAEKVDNDFDLFDAVLNTDAEIATEYSNEYNCNILTAEVNIHSENSIPGLYGLKKPSAGEKMSLRLIPYFAFANRGESDMRVWFKYIS